MRKPLPVITVITVTLSVVCTLKGMLRWSIQRIKAMLLCMVSCLSTLSIQRSKHAMHWMLCLSRLSIHWCFLLLHNTLYRVLWGVKTLLCWNYRYMLHDACNEIRSHPNSFHCICQHYRYIQSNYNVDSNMKSSNYSEIWFKALFYFE